MKTIKKSVAAVLFALAIGHVATAQTAKIAVLPLDSKGIVYDPQQLGSLLSIELEKTNQYNVLDKYEVNAALEKANVKAEGCFAKSCVIEAGRAVKVDKVLTGSVERYGEKLVVTLRLFDVKTAMVEKAQVNEFLNLQPEMQSMISITLNNMLGQRNNEDLVLRLTKKDSYENAVNNPGVQKVNMSGPRMGMTYIMGNTGERLTANKANGGYDGYPAMTQFGYQFETQYLNSGNFQALLEFIPLVTGIDQGYFIPSIVLMNGLRNTKYGLEFAFGPTFSVTKMADGYYDSNHVWQLASDNMPGTADVRTLPDNRGTLQISSGFVVAVGKTFKSGNLNIPVNAYIIPSKDGLRTGISFGFNTKK